MRRGRPKKVRPSHGAEITAEMSLRDKAAAIGVSRQELSKWMRLAEIPKDEFEAALAVPGLSTSKILARYGPGKAPYERRCPHCGGLLRREDF